jgi:hypothetical protein
MKNLATKPSIPVSPEMGEKLGLHGTVTLEHLPIRDKNRTKTVARGIIRTIRGTRSVSEFWMDPSSTRIQLSRSSTHDKIYMIHLGMEWPTKIVRWSDAGEQFRKSDEGYLRAAERCGNGEQCQAITESIKGTENQKAPSHTSNVLRLQTEDSARTAAVVTEGTLWVVISVNAPRCDVERNSNLRRPSEAM